MQFFEVSENALDVVECVRPLRVARELRDLPRRQVGENGFGDGLALGFEPRDFLGDIDFVIVADEAQLFDLGLKLGDRLFEVEKTMFHTIHYFAE